MKHHDILFELVLAVSALTILNRFVFHDTLLISFLCALATIASFWFGRLCVRFFRRRRAVGQVFDE